MARLSTWFTGREASRANAIWQVDHAQLDIRILGEDGSTARPWLTAVIDDYSRAVAGYYLGFEPPSSLRTALALRQGIWRKGDPHWEICGIPDMLYTDNGADFTSKHIEQVAVDLKVRLAFSTLGQPRGRGRIERFFRTVNEMFLCDLDGYGARPSRAPSLTLTDLDREFRKFCLRSTIAGRAQRGSPLPRRDGRRAPFCRACRSRWSSWISCSSMNCAVAGYDPMAFTSIASAIFHSLWRRTWAKK